MTPFIAFYGYHPPSITYSIRDSSKVQVLEDHMKHQQQFLQLLKDNLNLAQTQMKQQANKHYSEWNFNVGDLVFLRLQPSKHMSPKNTKKDDKLSPKY